MYNDMLADGSCDEYWKVEEIISEAIKQIGEV
jgi:hypothetical protein